MADSEDYYSLEKTILSFKNEIDELTLSADPSNQGRIAELRHHIENEWARLLPLLDSTHIVQIARHPKRPYTLDYLNVMVQDFLEIHGDRRFADDPAIVSGFGFYHGRTTCFIGHQKGRSTRDRLFRNFGQPNPEGYRKALRVMRLAEKFGFPIVTLVDTQGAYPGIGAEERGQAEAIAYNLREMVGQARHGRGLAAAVDAGHQDHGRAAGVGVEPLGPLGQAVLEVLLDDPQEVVVGRDLAVAVPGLEVLNDPAGRRHADIAEDQRFLEFPEELGVDPAADAKEAPHAVGQFRPSLREARGEFTEPFAENHNSQTPCSPGGKATVRV